MTCLWTWAGRSITEEGAAAMAEVVKRAHLKELNMYMNDIGDGGAMTARQQPQKSWLRRCCFMWLGQGLRHSARMLPAAS